LFFCGIGTFVNGASETLPRSATRPNDAFASRASDPRQGGRRGRHLGVTQRGRIAYAQKACLIDTDAIDTRPASSMSDQ